jgi:hypothetical protein
LCAINDFENRLLNARAHCENDEWALTKAREAIVTTMSPGEAYGALAGALELIEKQDSPFCFANCCWFVLDMARKADTTQFPPEALPIISALKSKANLLREQHELERVLMWFRILR